MKVWLIALLVCFVIFEIIEHLLFPLFWMIRGAKGKSACGPSGMIGNKCVVKQWNGTSGKVWVNGELWNANSQSPLSPGTETVIQNIEGLTLRVSPSDMLINTRKRSSANQ